jgi:hypothetical protein
MKLPLLKEESREEGHVSVLGAVYSGAIGVPISPAAASSIECQLRAKTQSHSVVLNARKRLCP